VSEAFQPTFIGPHLVVACGSGASTSFYNDLNPKQVSTAVVRAGGSFAASRCDEYAEAPSESRCDS